MKKLFVSVFCLFLFILSSPYAQIAKDPKVITINSVRVMEVFKKENKAQYSTKPDKTDKKKDTNSSEDKTESPTEQTAGTENISDTQTSVTTEEAQKAVEEKKDDIIVFTGGVSLSVKDGSTVSTIESDKLVYNRSENTIEAEGNVHYSRKSGGSDGAENSSANYCYSISTRWKVYSLTVRSNRHLGNKGNPLLQFSRQRSVVIRAV